MPSFRNEDDVEAYQQRHGDDSRHICTLVDSYIEYDIAPPSADMYECQRCYRRGPRETVYVCDKCEGAVCRLCQGQMVLKAIAAHLQRAQNLLMGVDDGND